MTSNPWAAARAAAQSSRPQTAPSTFVTFPPTAEQSEILAAFRRGEDMVITAGAGTGKALRDDQRVQTPNGPVPISALRVGDDVIGSNGIACSVTGVFPQGVRELFTLTTCDGVEIVADADHIWSCVFVNPNRLSRVPALRNHTTSEVAAALQGGDVVLLPVLRSPAELNGTSEQGLIREAMSLTSRRVGDIATVSVPDVDRFVFCVRALGGTATVHSPRTQGYPAVPVYVQCPPLGYGKDVPARRIVSAVPAAPDHATCISVDAADKLYATEGFVLTHNTSTIQLLAQDMTKTDPSGRGVYLAFNKSISQEIQSKVPYNVTASTIHSLAYRGCMSDPKLAALMPKLNAEKSDLLKTTDRPKAFGVPQIVKLNPDAPEGQNVLEVRGITLCVAAVTDALKNFCESDFDHVTTECVPLNQLPLMSKTDPKLAHGRRAFREYVAKLAQKMWDEDITQPNGRLPFGFDTYLKLYAMGNPDIAHEQRISGRAVLFFDEAQDSTGCITGMVMRQRGKMQIVVCGDSSQSIYRFRGSVDSLRAFADTEDVNGYALSQTFRFGPEVAVRANTALNHLPNSDVRIVPDLTKKSSVSHLPLERDARGDMITSLAHGKKLDAVVCRSNYDVMSLSIKLLAANIKTYADIDRVGITNAINDYERMSRGEAPWNKGLKEFGSKTETPIDHLKRVLNPPPGEKLSPDDAARKEELGNTVESTIRLIFQLSVPAIKNLLANLTTSERQADIILTTVHKAKGRQWRNVAVVWNVDPFDTANGNVDPYDTKHIDELMVWYVAVTRAQEKLWLGMDPCEGIRFDGDDTSKLVTAISGHHVAEAHPVLKEIREKNAKGYQISAAMVFAHQQFAVEQVDSRGGKLTIELLGEVGVESMLAARDIARSGIPLKLTQTMTPLTNAMGSAEKMANLLKWGQC